MRIGIYMPPMAYCSQDDISTAREAIKCTFNHMAKGWTMTSGVWGYYKNNGTEVNYMSELYYAFITKKEFSLLVLQDLAAGVVALMNADKVIFFVNNKLYTVIRKGE